MLTDLAGTRQVLAVDLDLDGLPELVGSNAGGGVLMENDGAGVFRRAVGRGIPGLDAETAVSDLDLDGDPDLVTAAAQSLCTR